jgi:carbamate kinase
MPGRVFGTHTVYGTPSHPIVAPKLTVVDADVAGELVADAVEAGRFLILTTPEVADHIRERGADIDAYLERTIKEYT